MGLAVTTTHTFEVNATLAGTFQPGCPEQGPTYASGGQPAEPDMVEDVVVTSLTVCVLVPAPEAERYSHPRGVWADRDLLDGLDDGARRIVLANVAAILGPLAEELLLEAVPEADDPDDERDRRRDDELTGGDA